MKPAQHAKPLCARCELHGLHLIAALVAAAIDQVCHGAGQLRDFDVLQPRLRRRMTSEVCTERGCRSSREEQHLGQQGAAVAIKGSVACIVEALAQHLRPSLQEG